MSKSARKSLSKIFVWAILGLLFVALAGFGIGSFSGGASRMGSVGDIEISAEDYARALDQELRARSGETGQNVTLSMLIANGIDAQVRQGLFARAALNNEAGMMTLSIGDEEIANQILQIPAFQGANGTFDRQAYEFFLSQRGLSAGEFEDEIRADIARSILQSAILGRVPAPAALVDPLVAYQQESRGFSYLLLTAADLDAHVPAPTEEQIITHYEAFPDRFTLPEAREITYIWITPNIIMDDIPVSDSTLQSLYQERIEEYRQPERRLVERLVYPTEAEAEAAWARLNDNSADFETLVSERGLLLEDTDMGDVTRDDLSAAEAEAVFAASNAEFVGPVASPFGPAIFRINAVLDATEIPFEEVQDDLRSEVTADAARRAISDLREGFDDLLASGATLEEVADETQMVLGTIRYDGSQEDGIAAYEAFRAVTNTIEDGDFPEILDLSDGGVFALRLDQIVLPTLPPLDDVRADVIADWTIYATQDALLARAEEIRADIAASGRRLERFGGLMRETDVRRNDFIADTPDALVQTVFGLSRTGEIAVVGGEAQALVVRLDAINPADRADPDTDLLANILTQQISQSLTADLFEDFGRQMQSAVGLTFNQSVVNQVHASFP